MDNSTRLYTGMDRRLYRASRWGDVKLLNQVLEDIDVFQQVTPLGDTALHTAAFYGHAQLASELIQLAVNSPEAGMQFLKAQNTDGETALHVAAKGGCEKIVKALAEKGDVAGVKNKSGETALFKASENGHVGIVKHLLDCIPPELDARDDGRTPLHVAVANLQTGVTKILLEKRPALVHKEDAFKRTALHILALLSPIDSALVLSHPIALYRSRANIRKIAKMIVDQEYSLMYRVDSNSQTALHLGAKVGNYVFVNALLRYGNDCTDILDKDGKTALHLAVENAVQTYNRWGMSAVRKIILSLALKRLIDCSDNNGQKALDIAIVKIEEAELLFSGIANYLLRHVARSKMFTTKDFASSTRTKAISRALELSIPYVVVDETVNYNAR